MNPDNLESEESKEKTGGSQAPQNEKRPVQAEAVQKKDELSQKFSPEKDGKKPVKASRKGLIIKCVAVVIVLAGLLVVLAIQLLNTGKRNEDASPAASGSSLEQESVSNSKPGLQAETVTPEEIQPAGTAEPTEAPAPSVVEVQKLSPDTVYSSHAILVRLRDHAVMLDKGAADRIYPASMTKIMTALVAIENLPDLEEQITLTAEQINPLYEEGASMAGFSAGETVTVRDLLYGVMLPSGADACVALADRIAGSEAGFVELMNQKAQELALSDTHFVTDSGLHDDNHYSTCADLARLLENALLNETFRTVFTAHDYTCTPTEYHPEGLYLASTMFQKMDTDTLSNGAVIEGGKTGYTDEAQLCLASLAVIQGEEYILVTAHAEGNHHTEQFNILDAYSVYGQITG